MKSLSTDSFATLKQIISQKYIRTFEDGYSYNAVGVAFHVKRMSKLRVKQLK